MEAFRQLIRSSSAFVRGKHGKGPTARMLLWIPVSLGLVVAAVGMTLWGIVGIVLLGGGRGRRLPGQRNTAIGLGRSGYKDD
jgi:hypothetical protein